MISDLRVVCISDVHVGNKRTKTSHILRNLDVSLIESGILSTTDMLVIAGDFFDDLLTYPSDDAVLINDWVYSFLIACKKHDVMIRVLEGTPSHDWKQPKIFTTLASFVEDGLNIRYVENLSIEYIPKFEMSVLYVPDEVNHDATITQSQVIDLLESHGLKRVDMAFMHGVFRYQMPIESVISHNEDFYESIVDEAIFIGHHHKHTRRGKIFAQGSFDRLCHGEEAAKGFGVYIREKGVGRIEFVENKNAKLYLTLDVRDKDAGNIIPYLEESVENRPDGSDFRLLVTAESEITSILKEIRYALPQFKFSIHREDAVDNAMVLRVDKEDIPKPIAITKENVTRLLMDKLTLTHDELELYDKLFAEVS